MRWRGRRQSSNIQDRRGRGGMAFPGGFGRPVRIPIGLGRGRGRAGGLSISTIVILIVLFLALRACGIDPLAMMGGAPSGPTQTGLRTDDERSQFVATVLAETEDVWNGIFEAEGVDYPEPVLVLFEGATQSTCGFASAASGPFYCPGDQQIYIDLSFFDQLSQEFGASGDFARAYVVAHEVGHHVQNVTGVLPAFNEARQSMGETEANAASVRVELQADCYAGIWAHFTEQRGLLEQGDIDEALNAATQIGDDTLQRRSQGYVVPESFNHGTSEQRRAWFQRGFESGRMEDCDTLNGPV